MSKKKPRDRPTKPEKPAKPDPAVLEKLRRRRNRRLIFVAGVGLSIPIFELVAYRFRAIELTIANATDGPITKVKVIYSGGEFSADEVKPGESVARLVRPDFSFKADEFSTYRLAIQFRTADGAFIRQMGRAGGLDYSAREIYSLQPGPPGGTAELKHKTYPGFPLGLVRDLMAKLGIG